ncbi:MAG: hypothetical protein KGL39_20565 [Patescibacteria group bacterium]|nr:hypothetical protein [Patescibacteria group bacterium]
MTSKEDNIVVTFLLCWILWLVFVVASVTLGYASSYWFPCVAFVSLMLTFALVAALSWKAGLFGDDKRE